MCSDGVHIHIFHRHVQKHSRLVAVVEALDNGKSIRETRDADTAVVVRHLYHHAGWAELVGEQLPGWSSVGVIGAIVPWNFPLMLLIWKVTSHTCSNSDKCSYSSAPTIPLIDIKDI